MSEPPRKVVSLRFGENPTLRLPSGVVLTAGKRARSEDLGSIREHGIDIDAEPFHPDTFRVIATLVDALYQGSSHLNLHDLARYAFPNKKPTTVARFLTEQLTFGERALKHPARIVHGTSTGRLYLSDQYRYEASESDLALFVHHGTTARPRSSRATVPDNVEDLSLAQALAESDEYLARGFPRATWSILESRLARHKDLTDREEITTRLSTSALQLGRHDLAWHYNDHLLALTDARPASRAKYIAHHNRARLLLQSGLLAAASEAERTAQDILSCLRRDRATYYSMLPGVCWSKSEALQRTMLGSDVLIRKWNHGQLYAKAARCLTEGRNAVERWPTPERRAQIPFRQARFLLRVDKSEGLAAPEVAQALHAEASLDYLSRQILARTMLQRGMIDVRSPSDVVAAAKAWLTVVTELSDRGFAGQVARAESWLGRCEHFQRANRRRAELSLAPNAAGATVLTLVETGSLERNAAEDWRPGSLLGGMSVFAPQRQADVMRQKLLDMQVTIALYEAGHRSAE